MNQQPMAFFIQLRGLTGTVIINIADILIVVPRDGGSRIMLRDSKDFHESIDCIDTPDEIALKLQPVLFYRSPARVPADAIPWK